MKSAPGRQAMIRGGYPVLMLVRYNGRDPDGVGDRENRILF